ncbi:hypothetical protein [Nocardia sp. XZ_19_385]|uniref:hypothetical protein n=1 Tax=Nocardia sp. XZ_19_385 TaxID=2769488 RepID=UPI00189064D0|nr:hypothetical protein [Nocardia sp. XZ_19_385]
MRDNAKSHAELGPGAARPQPLTAGFGFAPWLLAEPVPASGRTGGWREWLRANLSSPWAFAAITEVARTHG